MKFWIWFGSLFFWRKSEKGETGADDVLAAIQPSIDTAKHLRAAKVLADEQSIEGHFVGRMEEEGIRVYEYLRSTDSTGTFYYRATDGKGVLEVNRDTDLSSFVPGTMTTEINKQYKKRKRLSEELENYEKAAVLFARVRTVPRPYKLILIEKPEASCVRGRTHYYYPKQSAYFPVLEIFEDNGWIKAGWGGPFIILKGVDEKPKGIITPNDPVLFIDRLNDLRERITKLHIVPLARNMIDHEYTSRIFDDRWKILVKMVEGAPEPKGDSHAQ